MAYLTKREKEIIAYLKKDPTISQEELAKKLQITRSAAAVHISNLMRKGFILGRGYILDERSGVLIAGKAWLEINAQVEDSTIDLYCGGIGFLLATELAKQQLTPTFFTVLGKDNVGDHIYQQLQEKGVNVQHIIRSHSYSTPKRLIVRNGVRELYQIAAENVYNFKEDEKKKWDDLLHSAKVLLIDNSFEQLIEGLFEQIKEYNLFTSIIGASLNWFVEKGFTRLPQVFLVCDEHELYSFAGGFQLGLPETSFPVCQKIADQGLAALVVVFPQQGVVLSTKNETHFLPASPLKGTGSVMSITTGIAGGLAAGYGFRQATRRAMGKS